MTEPPAQRANPAGIPSGQACGGPGSYPAPLTPIQRAYLAGREAPPPLGGIGCTYYFEFLCENGLELSAIESAWNALVSRHEALRMVILDDMSFDVLDEPGAYVIEQRHLANAAELARMHVLLRSADRTPFRWPLFDVRASIDHAGVQRLHVRLDMMTLDAGGVLTILLELGALLRGESLPEIEGSFADHAHMIEALAAERPAPERRAVAPELPLLASKRAPRFVRRLETLDAEAAAGLVRAARDWGVSRNGVALAALAEVRRTWSTNGDFTINVVGGRRPRGGGSTLAALGDHSRALWVDCMAGGGRDLRERAVEIGHRLRERVSDMLGDRGTLFASDGAGTNLAPVVFASMLGVTPPGLGSPLREVAGLGTTGFAICETPHVNLDVHLYEDESRIIVCWYFVAELFPAGLAEAMFDAYVELLRRIATDPAVGAERAPARLPEGQRRQRGFVNSPSGEIPGGLLQDGFLERAARTPEAPAVFDGGQALSYAELRTQGEKVASWLRAQGLPRGGIVAVDLARGWRQPAAVLGVLMAGGVYLPCEHDWPPERVRRILADAGACAVISDRLGAEDRVEVTLGSYPQHFSPAPFHEPEEPANPGDLAYLIYTSGSTGQPKGVAVNHRAALNTIADINRRFAVGPGDRTLCLSSLAFDLSVFDIFGVLGAGGALVIAPPGANRDPRRLLALCRDRDVTIWNSVPALFQLAVEYETRAGGRLPDSLRLVLLSGDWIARSLPDRAQDLKPGLKVFSLGGATEASIWSIAFDTRETPEDWTSIPYGYPLANQGFHILDDGMRDRPDWVEGDLYIAGEGLAMGYWRDADKTAAAFVEHPVSGDRLYRTGDKARYRPGALIEFLGRRDQQVKIGGYRIETGEVEAALESLPGVRGAVVLAVDPLGSGQRSLQALIVRADGTTGTQRDAGFRERLAGILPSYMLPARILAHPELPLSANGKVDRTEAARILQQTGPGPEPPAGRDPPAPAAAGWAEIRSVVERELRLENLPRDGSLIELGASSIVIMRLAARLRATFGIEVRPVDLANAADTQALQALLLSRQAGRVREAASGVQGWLARNGAEILTDPTGRRRFLTETTLGRVQRANETPHMAVVLEAPLDLGTFDQRWSGRDFVAAPLPAAAIERVLRSCRMAQRGGELVAPWASAGSAYPLELALALCEGVDDVLAPGWWRYDPLAHRLEPLAPGAPALADLSLANREWLATTPGLIAISADMRRIAPLYGPDALRMTWVEIGALCDALERAGAEAGLGVCQVGDIDGERIDRLCGLPEGQFTLHAVALGVPRREARAARAARITAVSAEIEEGTV